MDLRTIKSTVTCILVGLMAYQGSARSEVYQSGIIDSIARSFGVELSDRAIELEQVPLGPAFRESFRSRSSLTAAAVRDYLNAHPSELLAFRDYSQSLHDSGYLDYDSTLLLIRSAFAGFAQNQGFLAEPIEKRAAVAVPATQSQTTTQAPRTARSASEVALSQELRDATTPDPAKKDVAVYQFGEELKAAEDRAARAEARQVLAELEANRKRKRLEAQAAFLMQELAKSSNPREKLLDRVNSILNRHTERVIQQEAERTFDNVQVSITSTPTGPEFTGRVLKNLSPEVNQGLVNYVELGLSDNDDRQTLNMGYGVRLLDPTETVMYGANVFFDQEWPNNHNRASVGVEMATTPFRLSANRYYALSGGKSLSGDVTERAMSGQDLRAHAAFPYLPNLFLDYSKFKWYGQDGLADVNGQSVGISGSLSDSLSLEISRKVYGSGSLSSQNAAHLTYNYVPGSKKSPGLFNTQSVPYVLGRLDAREKYAMTGRENEIQKQQTTAGLQVTFTSL